MKAKGRYEDHKRSVRILRLWLEYSVAVGLAALCGYWIVQDAMVRSR